MSSREIKLLVLLCVFGAAAFFFMRTDNVESNTQYPTGKIKLSKQTPVAQPAKVHNLDPLQQSKNKAAIAELLAMGRVPVDDIRNYGYAAIPILTEIYLESDNNREKSKIASIFWSLGWKSPEIEEALMNDLNTDDPYLKIQVQWGLAKSSQSDQVIEKLIHNLKHDPSALVRDKAACALASDFVHISPSQRIDILRGLVSGLASDIAQVRGSSIQALNIHTGQTMGFAAHAPSSQRKQAINAWNEWLDEYQQSI